MESRESTNKEKGSMCRQGVSQAGLAPSPRLFIIRVRGATEILLFKISASFPPQGPEDMVALTETKPSNLFSFRLPRDSPPLSPSALSSCQTKVYFGKIPFTKLVFFLDCAIHSSEGMLYKRSLCANKFWKKLDKRNFFFCYVGLLRVYNMNHK